MFSRFLNTAPVTFIGCCILMTLLSFLNACSVVDRSVSGEQFEKHYIEPPRQKNIPVSITSFRVCADPNNLPFSNQKGEGFENKIAELIARKMNLPLEYTWFAQRRGFFRNTLRDGKCDVVIGAPEKFERALSTDPYYYSTYVVVTRKDRKLNVTSLADPILKSLKIGVQMIGDDATNTPPAEVLADRGMVDNIVGYTVYGDYTQPNPPARIIDAVADGEVDIAIVWGPLAGFFAAKQKVPLDIRPIIPEADAKLPYVFGISLAVRYGEDEFKDRLDQILAEDQNKIERILDEYHIPRVAPPDKKFEMEGGE
jgi:mxaJ protein